MSSKIQAHHLARSAYIYLRQSTTNQVKHNQESTERQYALKDKALALGWDPALIKILDGDLGLSGSQSVNREDFKTLVADVSMKKVGAVFALEASRLSRSSTDWHRLLELCSLTGTLIIDEDGCYDPCDFNDQLLLGLKGTMSQAELHFIRARMEGGRRNKAEKGLLRCPLPIGLVYDQEGKLVLDPDEEVRSAVHLLFKVFRDCGSALGVVRHFLRHNLQFPKRVLGGAWQGKLIWVRLDHSRVLSILKNPSYAGAYVFGRYTHNKKISTEGAITGGGKRRLPMDEWKVLIHDHHERYISWQDYLANQQTLASSRYASKDELRAGFAREGHALLQGLLFCGNCGRRLKVHYYTVKEGRAYSAYVCEWHQREIAQQAKCMWLQGTSLEEAVSQRVLDVIKPAQLAIAMKAMEELEHREAIVNKQWLMKIERADYEAQLAQRAYEEVDPSHRLVVATLEKRWNDALENLAQLRSEYESYQQKSILKLSAEKREQILALANDLPSLWSASTTLAKDRKRILRLLIKDITAEKNKVERKVILHIRWQGGATEDLEVAIPMANFKRWNTSQEAIALIREFALEHDDKQIAALLNKKGIKSGKGKPFTFHSVKWLRFKHGIPACQSIRQKEELTAKEVAKKFGVTLSVVYHWARNKHIKTRQFKRGHFLWITLDAKTEAKLREKVRRSKQIKKSIGRNAL